MSDSMRLNAPKGQRVQFNGANGYDSDLTHAKRYLNTSDTYTVLSTEVGKSMSYVILEEFPDHRFNTVMFIEIEPFHAPQEGVADIYRESALRKERTRISEPLRLTSDVVGEDDHQSRSHRLTDTLSELHFQTPNSVRSEMPLKKFWGREELLLGIQLFSGLKSTCKLLDDLPLKLFKLNSCSV